MFVESFFGFCVEHILLSFRLNCLVMKNVVHVGRKKKNYMVLNLVS